MSRSKFDPIAREYDAGRPGYPDDLFDAVEELSGGFLGGSRVADIGAGTGIATRAMVARGAVVVAVDHGASMLSVLRQRTPQIPIVQADANALPFADRSFDFVTFAQSWHWVDLDRARAEVSRVVRPGGAVAMWWNTADPRRQQWLAEHRRRLEALSTNEVGAQFEAMWRAIPRAFAGFDVETTEISWQRVVTRDVILNDTRSKSYVVALGPDGVRELIEREAAMLPDGELIEPFVTRLAVIRIVTEG